MGNCKKCCRCKYDRTINFYEIDDETNDDDDDDDADR